MNKEETAKIFEDSGLFKGYKVNTDLFLPNPTICKHCDNTGNLRKDHPNYDPYEMTQTCYNCDNDDKIELWPYPKAGQSEKILSDLGLQVVFDFDEDESEHECFLIGFNFISITPPENKLDGLFQAECFITQFIGCFKEGERTIANNAALAWLVKRPEWLERLKGVLK